MSQRLTVSKCCASPLLARGNGEGLGWFACSLCKEPTDGMEYPFKTVKQMETWLKKKKAFVGTAYSADVKMPNACPAAVA